MRPADGGLIGRVLALAWGAKLAFDAIAGTPSPFLPEGIATTWQAHLAGFLRVLAGFAGFLALPLRGLAFFLQLLHPLRKGDMLHGFFATFREMQEAMRARARKEAEQFAGLAAQAEDAGLDKIAAELRALSKQRQDSLRASSNTSRTSEK